MKVPITIDVVAVINEVSSLKIICNIKAELLDVIAKAPALDNKEKYIHRWLDDHLSSVDLKQTFNHKVVVVYDEVMPVEILLGLHTWFVRQCGDIQNIILATTHHTGLAEWYNQYVTLNHTAGFYKIIETPFLSKFFQLIIDAGGMPKTSNKKDLTNYFSYYGGSYSTLERDFLAATFMSMRDHGIIEYAGGFGNINHIVGFAEQVTFFKNDELVKNICKVVTNSTLQKKAVNRVSGNGVIELDKSCAFHIIRETLNYLPYATATEKTIRTFTNNLIPFPIGFKSVTGLEKLGFKFDHHFINYNKIQNEPMFATRIISATSLMLDIVKSMSLSDLSYYIRTSETMRFNEDYVLSGDILRALKHIVEKEINK